MSSPSSEERNGAPPASEGSSFWSRFSWRAVLLGFVVDHGGTQVFGFVFGIAVGFVRGVQGHHGRASLDAWLHTTPMLLFALMMGLLFDAAGGFMVGRIAPRRKYWNATAVILIETLWGLMPSHFTVPLWCNVAGYALCLPCAWLGAFLGGIGATEPPPPLKE